MVIVRKIKELQKMLLTEKKSNQIIGFVPTMGFLHEGHLSLVEKAKEKNDVIVMSIFVNPAQFGPNEDFDAYPRDEKNDALKAEKAGVDILFIPDSKEMYPEKSEVHILPGSQSTVLCGASRPGHFDGVLKIVLKLFNIVEPDYAYFGMKDAQQLAIIESFVRDFNLKVKIERVPIVRDKDGLAKSSRNVNLTAQERVLAPIIQYALKKGEALFHAGNPIDVIERIVSLLITENSNGKIDYVSLLNYPALTPISDESKEIIIACAVQFEKVRLIDNIVLVKGEDLDV